MVIYNCWNGLVGWTGRVDWCTGDLLEIYSQFVFRINYAADSSTSMMWVIWWGRPDDDCRLKAAVHQ